MNRCPECGLPTDITVLNTVMSVGGTCRCKIKQSSLNRDLLNRTIRLEQEVQQLMLLIQGHRIDGLACDDQCAELKDDCTELYYTLEMFADWFTLGSMQRERLDNILQKYEKYRRTNKHNAFNPLRK